MSQLDDYSYGDDGFAGYEITTIDPGSSILIGTVIFCVSLYLFLPCVLTLLERRSCKRKRERLSEHRPEVIDLDRSSTCSEEGGNERRSQRKPTVSQSYYPYPSSSRMESHVVVHSPPYLSLPICRVTSSPSWRMSPLSHGRRFEVLCPPR